MALPIEQLGDDANRAMLALLDDFRKSVLLSLIQAQEPFSATYRQLLREVDVLLAQTQAQMTRTMAEHLEIAANAGDDDALDEVRSIIGTATSYVGVSPTLVRVASEYTADLIRGITDEARATITREVRLAALGGKTTTDLISAIGRALDDPGVFRTLAARAEAIARTETARIRNTAHFDQAKELNVKYEGIGKVWEHAGSSPGFSGHQRRQSRPNHVRTWQRTSENPIPVEDDFDLGGFTARYPHDPLLPASETVHCRCRIRLTTPEPEGERQTTGGSGQPAGTLVSDNLIIMEIGKHKAAVKNAVAAIDSVHGDGPLTPIPVRKTTIKDVEGIFQSRRIRGLLEPYNIGINPAASHPGMTMVHEVGHFLDFLGFQGVTKISGGAFTTANVHHLPANVQKLFNAWARAANDSRAFEALRQLQAGPDTVTLMDAGKSSQYKIHKDFLKYQTGIDEVWARSYAQYIATRSGNADLLRELDGIRDADRKALISFQNQWDDDDFAPIAAAFDDLFREMGWIT